jgi:phosphotransferase system  glucose/maltose/N-acetylglucosamine-specific IIC component
MHTQETERDSHTALGPAAKNVAEHASALVRLELELAQLELKRKAAALAKGIGLGLGAAVFLLFALGFGIGAAAAGIATATSAWVALLIVSGALVLVALVLGLLALQAIKKATPPVPEQALREAKRTTEALRSDGNP